MKKFQVPPVPKKAKPGPTKKAKANVPKKPKTKRVVEDSDSDDFGWLIFLNTCALGFAKGDVVRGGYCPLPFGYLPTYLSTGGTLQIVPLYFHARFLTGAK